MLQKIHAISFVIAVFFFATSIPTKAGIWPLSHHDAGDAPCERIRMQFPHPTMMSWQMRLMHWTCYPEYVPIGVAMATLITVWTEKYQVASGNKTEDS